jgi:hypothetical protein
MTVTRFFCAAALVLWAGRHANAQHLWWDLAGQTEATCLYGEITVLATNPSIYYCGANWHPGEPAGGYCGIQDNGPEEKRTIFSIWDTSPKLHLQVTEANPHAVFNRFTGEGSGTHTHMRWSWRVGHTFQFFAWKRPGKTLGSTDARYYIRHPTKQKWLHVATINCPGGGKKSVATFGGGLNSFLENFAGKDREVPKLVLYRLWLGPSVTKMKCLTRAGGDGVWGQLHGAYFLAEGDAGRLKAVFSFWQKKLGKPTFGEKGKRLGPIPDKAIPAKVIEALKRLPKGQRVAR